MAALLWLAAAIGRRTLRLAGADSGDTRLLERGVVACALGLGFLQYLPLGLGAIGMLNPAALGACLALLALLFAADGRMVARAAIRGLRGVRAPRGWGLAVAGVVCLALAAAALHALCPVTDPDGVSYHLAAPKRWLQWGNMGYLPTLLHTNAPMGVEALFTIPLGLWSDTAAKLVHWAMGVLALVGLFALGRRLGGKEVGLAAAGLYVLAVPKLAVLPLFGYAYVDLGVSLEVVAAFLGWAVWRRARGHGWLWAACLCAGFAGSYKLTGVFTGVAVIALALTEGRRLGPDVPRRLAAALAGLLLSALPVLPWLGRSWYLTGNPVWPLLAEWFPTRDWNVEGARWFVDRFRYDNWGTIAAAGLSRDAREVVRWAAMTAMAVGGALLAWRWRHADGRRLAAALAALAVVAIWNTGLYLRFLVPLVAVGWVLVALAAHRPLRRWAAVGWALAALFAWNAAAYVRQEPPGLGEAAAVAVGIENRDAYLARYLPAAEVCRYANEHLPPTAIILSGAGGGMFYSDPYCAMAVPFQQWVRLDTNDHLIADLQRRGVGYVLVSDLATAGYPHLLLATIYGAPVGPRVAGAQLYRLRWAAAR